MLHTELTYACNRANFTLCFQHSRCTGKHAGQQSQKMVYLLLLVVVLIALLHMALGVSQLAQQLTVFPCDLIAHVSIRPNAGADRLASCCMLWCYGMLHIVMLKLVS